MTLKLSYAGKTDVGLVRTGNEDSFKIDADRNLFLVCDGMGGHQAGEVASSDACETINYCFSELVSEINENKLLDLEKNLPPAADLLVKAIRIANRSIYIRSRSNSALTGMGTTFVGCVFEDDFIHVAHVGDSRAYLMTDSALTRLTIDHSWVSEMQAAGQMTEEKASKMVAKNVITRALGVNEKTEIDIRSIRIESGKTYIFCSDGLCGFADDDEILLAAMQAKGDLDAIAKNLVQLANDHGGGDNVTVVAIRVDEIGEPSAREPMDVITIPKESDETLMAENKIVDSMLDLKNQSREEKKSEPEKKSGKFSLILLFVLFIVVAAAFIYFNSGAN
ncbi:MAG: Stp1/IreP family PP2C-type Ser/Thr phosphatase [candidate division Zixibacteria bacterium]|nr:Stp1/IreP family PP2C-type Ser/Thr phosphatase [candidate division Zixibacteria bacterium]